MITIPIEQKREFLTENFLKYGKFVLPYCSKKCEETHQAELAKSKFLIAGTLKNHEQALLLKGVNTSKRFKNKDILLLAGNNTELQARLLREKLILIQEGGNVKPFASKDIQSFILKDLPPELIPDDKNIYRAAWRIMNKCRELFPNEILIESNDGENRTIRFIKQVI
jgi:hypothetical protein